MKLAYVSKRHETDNVYSFQFMPIEPVEWLPGQSIRLEIKGHERRFSVVSAPFEQNIAITTRISDSKFKQLLIALQPQEHIDGFNIEGTFLWEPRESMRILFASGVGITPYISMFRQLHHDKSKIAATLIYAHRDENFLFGAELKALQLKHPELFIDFLPKQQLSQTIISQYSNKLRRSLVYLCGAEAMVNDITPLLLHAGVKKNMLKRDIYTGRAGWENK